MCVYVCVGVPDTRPPPTHTHTPSLTLGLSSVETGSYSREVISTTSEFDYED